MEATSLCLLLAATLSVRPDRSQFLQYDHVELSCAANWTVRRTTVRTRDQTCGHGWSIPNGSRCTIEHAYPVDSGQYWCQDQHGGRGCRVNLTVTDGELILESPAGGVAEGDDAVLRCTDGKRPVSASFYKDGVFSGGGEQLLLKRATAADQGSYQCKHPTRGESPQSFLLVRGRPAAPPAVSSPAVPWTRLACGVLLFLFYSVVMVLAVFTFRRCYRGKKEAKSCGG